MIKKLFPNEELIRTKYFNVMQDWEVPIPGFFILAANRKLRSIAEFTDEEKKDFINTLVMVRKAMEKALEIKTVVLFQNEDTEYNFHVWIFPRHSWMEKYGNKMKSVPEIVEYAKENMVTDKIIKEVKEYVKIMKEYLKAH